MGWHFHTIQMCPLCGKFYFLKLRPHFPNACDHHVVSLYKDGDSYSPSFAPARDANNHFIFLTLSIWNWNKLVEWCILNFNTRTRWSETVRSGIRIQNTKAVNDNFYIFKKQKMVGNGIIIRKNDIGRYENFRLTFIPKCGSHQMKFVFPIISLP